MALHPTIFPSTATHFLFVSQIIYRCPYMYRVNLTSLTANSSLCEGTHPSATFQMSHLSSADWKEICGCVLFWGGLNYTDKTATFPNILSASTFEHLRQCFSISAPQHFEFNPLNAELNTICHLLALVGKGKATPITRPVGPRRVLVG